MKQRENGMRSTIILIIWININLLLMDKPDIKKDVKLRIFQNINWLMK
jgi:hypothetical protein